MIRATARTPARAKSTSRRPSEGQGTPTNGNSAPSTANLTPLVGKIVRVYLRGKRSLSDGWHCGKLLSVAKGKAVIELRHKTTVSVSDVEAL